MITPLRQTQERQEFFTRAGGVVQGTFGVVETGVGIVGGFFSSPTVIGAVGFGALAANGADNAQAGFRTAFSGESQNTFLNEGLQAAGLSPGQAAIGEVVLSLGSAGGSLVAAGRTFTSKVFVGQEVDNLFGQGGAIINGKVIRTVPTDVSQRFQDMGYLDPVSNTFKKAPVNETMAVDHIYPVKEIMRLPKFNKLTTEQQILIIHDRIDVGNLQPLPKHFNSSKGSKIGWSTYKKNSLDSEYVRNLTDVQIDVERSIQRRINEFYKLNIGKM